MSIDDMIEAGAADETEAFVGTLQNLTEERFAADAARIQGRSRIAAGILELVRISGENSRDHGFHEDFPGADLPPEAWVDPKEMRRAIAEKLDLIHSEISEALEEVRKGHPAGLIYFTQTIKYLDDAGRKVEHTIIHEEQAYDEAGNPQYKPEGFIVEIADAMIRQADLTYLLGLDRVLPHALHIKHEYNATRPFKHGKKF